MFESLRFRAETRWVAWKPTVLVVSAISLSGFFAYHLPTNRQLLLMVGLLPMLAMITLIFRYPPLGLIITVAAGLAVPFSLGTGTQTTLHLVALFIPILFGHWLLHAGLYQRQIRLHPVHSVYIIIAFTVVVLLAFILGQMPWYTIARAPMTAQIGGLAIFLISIMAFILAAHQLDQVWLQRLVFTFLLIGTFYMMGRLFPAFGYQLSPFFVRGSASSAFWIWLVALPTGLAFFDNTQALWRRSLLLGLSTITLYVGIQQAQWASGWFPGLVGFFVIVWLRFRRLGWTVAFIGLIFFVTNFEQIFGIATTDQSWWARRQAWQIVLEISQINPILGLGPANYFFYVQQATIFGWGGTWNVQFSSHNNYVDLIAQTGLLGLSLFIWFAISVGSVGWKLFKELPQGFVKGYVAASLGGLVGTLVSGMLGDWILPFVYNVGIAGMRSSVLFWIFLGGLLALHLQSKGYCQINIHKSPYHHTQ
ncbi:MAG: O-antigen ligase family protein [Anaerolineales bacterium]|nr:O-antigen ligase family protein [Anaerolineales bacterium]